MTTNPDDDAPRSRLRWLVGAAAVLAVPLVVIWWPGCRQYPPVTSRESLSLMRLLYAACNTRDEARLGRVEARLEQLTREGKMTPEERAGFDRIVAMARSGEWERAEREAFRFAEDQVGQGDSEPDRDPDPPKPPKKKPKG
ncbi:MAG: hypothetical protein C0501_02115 [Isosphaera sp.]|nr:hypothetical protein [Isosphaera sp.]